VTVTALLLSALAACDGAASDDATPLWIVEVDVYPASTGTGVGITVGDTDVDPKCGDAAQAKCISWETQNPAGDGMVVADQDVTDGSGTVAAGEDAAEALFGDAFPRELYTYDEYAFDLASGVTLTDGTTFTFSWVDDEGTEFTDTLGYGGGVFTE
jgi:hypothetical protein